MSAISPVVVRRIRFLLSLSGPQLTADWAEANPLATARGTDPASADCAAQVASGTSTGVSWQDQYRER